MTTPEGTALPVTGRIPAALLIATLASGTAALIYESLWTRSFAIILGSTMQASAVVFSSFLCGLGLGRPKPRQPRKNATSRRSDVAWKMPSWVDFTSSGKQCPTRAFLTGDSSRRDDARS